MRFIPLIIAMIILGAGYWGLNPDRNPNAIPSVLISQPAPEFDLPAVPGLERPGLSKADLMGRSDPAVVNVFASWCVPCRAEHKVLTRLAREQGFDLMGINYKDKTEDAVRWLSELGNPYVRIGQDLSGRAGIEWGISGVPETFIVDGDGTVVWRYVGPIATEASQNELRAALAEARGQGAGS